MIATRVRFGVTEGGGHCGVGEKRVIGMIDWSPAQGFEIQYSHGRCAIALAVASLFPFPSRRMSSLPVVLFCVESQETVEVGSAAMPLSRTETFKVQHLRQLAGGNRACRVR